MISTSRNSIAGLSKKFNELWTNAEPRVFQAPGRVNLIGEHTDYNDGFVLPIALDFTTKVLACSRMDEKVEIYSTNYDELKTFDFNSAPRKNTGEWVNYAEGVARVLRDNGLKIGGANLLISSDVPVGAGLSSSAAIEIAVGYALTSINNINIDKIRLALAGQASEHQYVGTKSGIMDQFAAAFGRANHALLIDCRKLQAKSIPLHFDCAEIIVCNSGVKHSLSSSEYNTRREECEKAVTILREFLPEIMALRDVSRKDLKQFAHHLPETIYRRCRHVVTENERTLQTAEAFEHGEIELAGKLMLESHESLRDDYEVSCKQLDTLVALAESFDGVYGARMTGGGFGGCTVNLVRRDKSREFIDYLREHYAKQTGITAEIFHVCASDGVSEIKNLNKSSKV